MKARFSLLLLAVLSLFVLAACGGDTASPTSGSGTTGGSTGGSTDSAATEMVLGVSPSAPLKFDKETITVKAGQQVNLTFDNSNGSLPHSVAIDEANLKIPENIVVGLGAGEKGSATFTAPAAGEYTYYCGVPGHKEGGMVGKLIVEP